MFNLSVKTTSLVGLLLLFSAQLFAAPPKGGEELVPYRKGNLWGYSDIDKKLKIEAYYQEAHFFVEGLAAVKQNNKWGFINAKEKIVVPFVYTAVDDFNEGLAAVVKDKWCGFIDKKGKIYILHAKNNVASIFSIIYQNRLQI